MQPFTTGTHQNLLFYELWHWLITSQKLSLINIIHCITTLCLQFCFSHHTLERLVVKSCHPSYSFQNQKNAYHPSELVAFEIRPPIFPQWHIPQTHFLSYSDLKKLYICYTYVSQPCHIECSVMVLQIKYLLGIWSATFKIIQRYDKWKAISCSKFSLHKKTPRYNTKTHIIYIIAHCRVYLQL